MIELIEKILYEKSFKINDYTDCGVYYTNGYWYKSNGKGEFVYLGKDVNFEHEENFKA